ncbi:uncharacterized protein BDW47DRAFT_40809 [Aspergillus candidus]|uniref:Uncharacterized protein n=1 Tax=Aspergillus candidus TaxID=41067 RepID=A0A2I2F978_ASPCN|nr:hypothetical protein BDW47DRAFT_40809 [Aspergillus candidus]PLB37194.1 hypothetical protein BDW47DRAFT_40809 [Aspergillus candidus]
MMSPLRSLLRSSSKFPSRSLSTCPVRLNQSHPTPDSNPNPSSFKQTASRYRLFASPFAKVFLGGIFTYQVIYWTWLKLEMDESKWEKRQEATALEKEARELTASQK